MMIKITPEAIATAVAVIAKYSVMYRWPANGTK